jgi:hypothetical protein
MMMTNRTKLATLAVAAIAAAGMAAFAVDELLDGDDDYYDYMLVQSPPVAEVSERSAAAPPSTVTAPPTTAQMPPPAAPMDSTAQVPPAAATPLPPAPAPAPPATPPPAPAPPATPPPPARGAGPVDAQQAMRIGATAAGGTAIDVWPGTEGGRSVFYVDVRTSAGLVEAYVDAATGKVLAIEPGD